MHQHPASNGPSHDLLSTLDTLMQRRSVLASTVVVHSLLVFGLLTFSIIDFAKQKSQPPEWAPAASQMLN